MILLSLNDLSKVLLLIAGLMLAVCALGIRASLTARRDREMVELFASWFVRLYRENADLRGALGLPARRRLARPTRAEKRLTKQLEKLGAFTPEMAAAAVRLPDETPPAAPSRVEFEDTTRIDSRPDLQAFTADLGALTEQIRRPS